MTAAPTATTAAPAPPTATATVIRAAATAATATAAATATTATAATAVVVARRVVRAMPTAAVVVSRLGLTRGGPAQRHKAHASSHERGQAHHGLSPGQFARGCVIHQTPACP